jgi:hypothetical protein
MRKKTKWPWKLYFLFFLYAGITQIVNFFDPGSAIDQYYQVLIAFKKNYALWYGFHFAAIIVEIVSIIPLFLFVFKKNFLSPALWRSLLIARILLIFLGHHYEIRMLTSYFYASSTLALASIVGLVVVLLPSYVAHIACAFPKENKE